MSAAKGDTKGCPRCNCCFIVPPVVLREHSRDATLDRRIRTKLQDTYLEVTRLKLLREASRVAALNEQPQSMLGAPGAVQPQQQVFDCQHRQSLPGIPIAAPASAADAAIKTTYTVTARVDDFYRQVLGRNSIDNRGIDIASSVHYRMNFDNAFWNGQQMVYGDGDGQLFSEFYKSPDVIGHELTHGVTQYESGLSYEGESGALNESISDVFGAVFNQWVNNWAVTETKGWLIGAGIMGQRALANGKTCLRDMLEPAADHCLSAQPASYEHFDPTADVHINSGIPNRAFAALAQAAGGNAWDRALKVWYAVCTGGDLHSNATFVDFAQLTIAKSEELYEREFASFARQAWTSVQLPI
ncbi:hypothetical protein LMG28614_06493 [Paraburkholderia ultramafica]|uniref:Neutral metalloproteinase n=1 Tax=Paraburkholderia ultramafica TaxID=1544867 RepID=A0A6S7BN68_9BURK|nr:M4 family metallopeptidase [Paraburkholderia ultramafica]CAB3806895.1 hypothetical protein LMG28614_06493 [Paraburkholderia ultramafica]